MGDWCFRDRWPQTKKDYMLSIPSSPVACASSRKCLSAAGKNEFRIQRRMLEIVKSSWGREESIK